MVVHRAVVEYPVALRSLAYLVIASARPASISLLNT